MSPWIHKNSGFTLIELLVATAIIVLLILGLFGLLMSGLKTGQSTQAKESLQVTNALVLNNLVQELRWSNSAAINKVAGQPDTLLVTTSQYGVADQLVTYGVDEDQRLFRQIGEDITTRALLTPEKVAVEAFGVDSVSYQAESPYPLLRIQLKLTPASNQVESQLASMVVSVRKREFVF